MTLPSLFPFSSPRRALAAAALAAAFTGCGGGGSDDKKAPVPAAAPKSQPGSFSLAALHDLRPQPTRLFRVTGTDATGAAITGKVSLGLMQDRTLQGQAHKVFAFDLRVHNVQGDPASHDYCLFTPVGATVPAFLDAVDNEPRAIQDAHPLPSQARIGESGPLGVVSHGTYRGELTWSMKQAKDQPSAVFTLHTVVKHQGEVNERLTSEESYLIQPDGSVAAGRVVRDFHFLSQTPGRSTVTFDLTKPLEKKPNATKS